MQYIYKIRFCNQSVYHCLKENKKKHTQLNNSQPEGGRRNKGHNEKGKFKPLKLQLHANSNRNFEWIPLKRNVRNSYKLDNTYIL